MEELTVKVESKRKEMVRAINEYGINSQEALKASQELDLLIALFQNLINVFD